MIKNIIFDIGGVLVEFDPMGVLLQMGLTQNEADVIATKTVLGSLWTELDRGVMTRDEVFEQMIKNVPDELKIKARQFLYDETLKTVKSYDYSRQWLKGLKEKGYRIFLLTNYPEWMFDYHWENEFTFADFVDGKIVSGKVKLIKPDVEIYKKIMNEYNLITEESIFIDDRAENIDGAKKCGLNGIVFNDYESVKLKLEEMLKF